MTQSEGDLNHFILCARSKHRPSPFCCIWIPTRRRAPYLSWSLSLQPTQVFCSQDSMLKRGVLSKTHSLRLRLRDLLQRASLLETETLALEVRPSAMVSLSVVLFVVGCDVDDCCAVDGCMVDGL